MEFEITQQQWDWLTRSPCYLCGYQETLIMGLGFVIGKLLLIDIKKIQL